MLPLIGSHKVGPCDPCAQGHALEDREIKPFPQKTIRQKNCDLRLSNKILLSRFAKVFFLSSKMLPLILLEVKSISACAMLKHEAAIDKMSCFWGEPFQMISDRVGAR